jgi:hypothetical protein
MLGQLRREGLGPFVLWGRSMGATSALLYSLRYRPQDVLLQVVDSPFYSFQMIAAEIANKNVKAPEFVISLALQLASKNCAKFHYNPFEIDLQDVGECQLPALFVYCEEDSVINCQNTHLICAKYRAVFEKLVIPENHNTVRTQTTLDKIFAFIEKYAKKPKQRLSQQINDLYFDTPTHPLPASTPPKRHSRGKSIEKGGLRKGIERV